MPVVQQNCPAPGPTTGLDVMQDVAHHPGLTHVDAQLATRLHEQARLRFPTETIDRIGLDNAVGSVRAIIKAPQRDARLLQTTFEIGAHYPNVGFPETSVSDAPLVRHDDEGKSRPLKQPQGREYIGIETKPRRVDVQRLVFDERAILVEKYCRYHGGIVFPVVLISRCRRVPAAI